MSSENRCDSIRLDLTDRILKGELPPGHRLDEQKIADRFQVSRTPIREALQQLAAAGLVEIKPRRGAFVIRRSREQILDLFEAMGELEALCAKHAAGRMTMIEISQLEQIVAEGACLAADGSGEEYARINLAFHQAIFEGAHNDALMEMATILRQRTSPYRNAQFTTGIRNENETSRQATSQREHEEILDAIRSRNADRAFDCMSRHLTASSMTIARAFGTLLNIG